MKKTIKLILIALFVSSVSWIQAVPAYPYPTKIKQPDGSELTVMLRGDEFHKYHVTEDGYLLTKDSKGIFNYAKLDTKGEILSTGVKANNLLQRDKAEQSFLENLSQIQPSTQIANAMRTKRVAKKQMRVKPQAKFPKQGSPRSLVILVNFSDESFVIPNPQEAFTNMLNQANYSANRGTGSARDYFRDNTMGELAPQFDVVGPYTLPNPYKFYGENDADGFDKNPAQMVVDACKLAHEAGVNFAEYDTDNDGVVDNVFIYYAGYNEAEWGEDDTVWPHRWAIYPSEVYGGNGNYTGSLASVTFNSKRLEDYACASELKSNTGTNMTGIGTFVHEFSHVLGLADMYATDGSDHFTLSFWNIMDAGVYLNEGRTPPAYNSFERFQLGYLTPELIDGEVTNKSLGKLLTTNQAYLISTTDSHNLDGDNPNPAEFFLLENRQKSSWDAFLPGHGMLIYRVNYDAFAWAYNEPNNDPDAMGVQLMVADGLADNNTLGGDPFPGTSNVTNFDFVTRSGSSLSKGIFDIAETDESITFSIRKPLGIPRVPDDVTTIEAGANSFTATWSAVEGAESYLLNVYTKAETGELRTVLSENFDGFTDGSPDGNAASTDVSGSLDDYTQSPGWTGTKVFQAGGSVKIGSSSSPGNITLPTLDLSADEGQFTLNFDAMAWGGDDTFMSINIDGNLLHSVTDLNNESYTFKSYSIPFTVGSKSTSIQFESNKKSRARFFIDNVVVQQGAASTKVPVANSPFSVNDTSFQVLNLDKDQIYYYTVVAVKGTEVSESSKEVGPISLTVTGLNSIFNQLQVWSENKTLMFQATEGETVEVYNVAGQKIVSAKVAEGLNKIQLQADGVVIVKVGNRVGKLIL